MTDNLNKADEELLNSLYDIISGVKLPDPTDISKEITLFDIGHGETNGLEWGIWLADELMQDIKQRDAIRDKAIHLEALDDIETVASDYRALGFNADYQKIINAWKLDYADSKYTMPGFENTMSDLDELTVKPANEEEKA